jgi:hypothetical protein
MRIMRIYLPEMMMTMRIYLLEMMTMRIYLMEMMTMRIYVQY